MALVYRDDPYPGYNFEIVVNGINDDGTAVRGSLQKLRVWRWRFRPSSIAMGPKTSGYARSPGLKKYTNIVLKRGYIGDIAMWNWILEGMKGLVSRQDGSVIMLDENRREVMRFNFTRGWPCKYTGPGMNAKNNEIAMETLEICHEGLEIDGQA